MAAWIAPATWANGSFTAAFANAEVRDHLVWLKAFADLITGSTAADSGSATQIGIIRASGSASAFGSRISGDTQPRYNIDADGTLEWGGGSSAADVRFSRTGVRQFTFEGVGGIGQLEFLVNSPSAAGLASQTIAVNVPDGANPGVRIAIGTDALSNPELYMRRPSGATMRLTSLVDNRWDIKADSGDPRVGVIQSTAGTDTNSLFAWVAGDTNPRAAIGITSSGGGKLSLGVGGGTAPDVNMFRSAANLAETDFSLDLRRASATNGVLLGRVTGDGSAQFVIYARGHGAFLDGISTLVKSGAVTDADFRATPPSGTIAIDTANSKIYVRMGATWKSTAALT